MPATKKSTVVLLGNGAPMMQEKILHPETGEEIGTRGRPAKHIRQSETRVQMQPGFDDPQLVELTLSTDNDRPLAMIARSLPKAHRGYAIGIQHLEQLWSVHSASDRPDWVECEDKKFAEAIAAHFGCAIGRPEMLLTNAGRDALHAQHLSGTQPAGFNFMALSANATAESTASTTLPGEITTAGGGLVRGSATYAHTTGTNTSTLTKTFTANGSDSLPVTLAKIGVLNASSSGTLGYEKLLTTTSTLSSSGDNITATWTDTVG